MLRTYDAPLADSVFEVIGNVNGVGAWSPVNSALDGYGLVIWRSNTERHEQDRVEGKKRKHVEEAFLARNRKRAILIGKGKWVAPSTTGLIGSIRYADLRVRNRIA